MIERQHLDLVEATQRQIHGRQTHHALVNIVALKCLIMQHVDCLGAQFVAETTLHRLLNITTTGMARSTLTTIHRRTCTKPLHGVYQIGEV